MRWREFSWYQGCYICYIVMLQNSSTSRLAHRPIAPMPSPCVVSEVPMDANGMTLFQQSNWNFGDTSIHSQRTCARQLWRPQQLFFQCVLSRSLAGHWKALTSVVCRLPMSAAAQFWSRILWHSDPILLWGKLFHRPPYQWDSCLPRYATFWHPALRHRCALLFLPLGRTALDWKPLQALSCNWCRYKLPRSYHRYIHVFTQFPWRIPVAKSRQIPNHFNHVMSRRD